MGRLLIIGCGGVASVAIHKCCQNSDTFTEICIASRTKSKCDALKEKLEGTTKTVITTAQVDADNVEELKALINSYKPQAVLNVVLTILILQTMSQRIQMIQSGELFMKSAARMKASLLTLIIHGSGHIRSVLKRQV